jgi:8-oxo-dGTP pyrophosphatase MutT (NUDIX family)
VTVAAVVCQNGRYLLVEEDTSEGVRLNQPAGHLDAGESLVDAAIRETLEETTRTLTPEGLLGVYLATTQANASRPSVTYLRFAFVGHVGDPVAGRRLDKGIRRTVWLTSDEIRAQSALHRSPLVMRCIEDHASARPLSALSLLYADASALHLAAR